MSESNNKKLTFTDVVAYLVIFLFVIIADTALTLYSGYVLSYLYNIFVVKFYYVSTMPYYVGAGLFCITSLLTKTYRHADKTPNKDRYAVWFVNATVAWIIGVVIAKLFM